jgi:hypothetical protein
LDPFESFASRLYLVNDDTFDDIALELFHFQAQNNSLYQTFIQTLGIRPSEITKIIDIPFMPISFFKRHLIKTGAWVENDYFTSSGSTGVAVSRHAINNLNFYLSHAQKCFSQFFGDLKNFHLLALLPSYLERTGSSLIAMIDHFIRESESPFSGFYLSDISRLLADLEVVKSDSSRTTILWGVSFALLDLAENHSLDLQNCFVFETGGMKGRRKEITRTELHQYLRERFNVKSIHSEYGMTELFSQAYTIENELFKSSRGMKVIGRDLTDPFTKGLLGETCGINVIDLANWHSIGFIETEDLGKVYQDGSFEVLGRIDNSDVRGCNLLVE